MHRIYSRTRILYVRKDFSRYAFDNEIYGKLDQTMSRPIITSSKEYGLSRVTTKFLNRSNNDFNSDKETKFVDRYFNIPTSILNEYYSITNDASEYVANYYDSSLTTTQNQTMKNNLDALYNYLIQQNF